MFGCNRCFGAGVLSAILFGKFSGRQGEGQTHKRTAGNDKQSVSFEFYCQVNIQDLEVDKLDFKCRL